MPRSVALALLALLCISVLVPSSAADDDDVAAVGAEAAQVEAEATAGDDGELTDDPEEDEVAAGVEAAAEGGDVVAAQVPLTVRVTKTNDANGDGVFNKNDGVIVPFSGLVPFSVTITNTSSVPVQIIGLTDQNPPGSTPVSQCTGLIGAILFPGQSVICNFTDTVSLSAPGALTVDRFRAVVAEVCLDLTACSPPCPVPPITPLPPPLVNCLPATNIGSGEDESGVFGLAPPPPPPPTPAFTVQKTNNADGNGLFTDSETAPAPGAAVTFQVVVTNTSNGPITITNVTDQFSGQAPFVVCNPALVNQVLGAGQSATCQFTLPNYSPAAGTVRRDVVAVTAMQACPRNVPPAPCLVTVSDPSIVFTQGPPLTMVVDKTNDADGDGTYTDVETAPGVGQPVTFRVVVTNPTTVTVNITSVTDLFPGQAAFSVCANLIGPLLPGASTPPCTFTVANYSPPEGTSKVNTVTVNVIQPCEDPFLCRRATGTDTSTVNTESVPPPTTTLPPTTPTTAPLALPPPTSPPATTQAPVPGIKAQSAPRPLALTGWQLLDVARWAGLCLIVGALLWHPASRTRQDEGG